jgi:hypothetical protein
MRQIRDDPLLERKSVRALPLIQHLDLHLRHVDAGRALALAALAAHAEIERVARPRPSERTGTELPGQRKAKRVRAAAREMLLVASHAIARAHRPCVELAAVTVVVAHLDRLGEPERRIATGARRSQRLRNGIVLHVPRRPVERGGERCRALTGTEREERRVVHLRGPNDLAWVHQAHGSKRSLISRTRS